MNKIYATNHAYQRAKERFGWKRDRLNKKMHKAYSEGLDLKNSRGALTEFLITKYLRKGVIYSIKIYNNIVFVFHKRTVITVYKLPAVVLYDSQKEMYEYYKPFLNDK